MSTVVALVQDPILRFTDNSGKPLVNGTLLTQVGGSNYPTYSESTGSVALPNPIVLNSRGEIATSVGASCPLFVAPNVAYTYTLSDSQGNLIWSAPNIVSPSTVNAVLSGLTQSALGQIITPQTPAEVLAAVVPTNYAVLQEGNVVRYGALTSAADNSGAFADALLVSAFGGNAAYAAPGTFTTLSTINSGIAPNTASSMYGAGRASVIAPVGCDGLTLLVDGAYAGSRFFRDFMIQGTGTATVTNTNNGIAASVLVGGKITGVEFSNLTIQWMGQGASLEGLWFAYFQNCFLVNNYQGWLITGLSAGLTLEGGDTEQGNAIGTGTSYGLLCDTDVGDDEQPQAIEIRNHNFTLFDIAICFQNVFAANVEGGTINFALQNGIKVVSTLGGISIRDIFIQTDNAAYATIGINLVDIATADFDKVTIDGVELQCNLANAGSQGIYAGVNRSNISITNCTIGAPNFRWNTGVFGSAIDNLVIKGCTIAATAVAIQINSLAENCQIGPNVIQPGVAQAATMTNSSANINVVDSTQYAVGNPVQFDATANGFTLGVDYYVLTSSANVITVGPYATASALTATGSTAVNVFVQLAPLTFNVPGSTPPGLQFNGRGMFLGTLTGLTTTVQAIVTWSATGGDVTLSVLAMSGTSNATTMTLLGLPGYLWPHSDQSIYAGVEDNGTKSWGSGTVAAATGIISLFKDVTGAAFTGSGTKALLGNNITYSY